MSKIYVFQPNKVARLKQQLQSFCFLTDSSDVSSQSSDTSTAVVTQILGHRVARGRRGGRAARGWSVGRGRAAQNKSTDVVETFGRPVSVSGRFTR